MQTINNNGDMQAVKGFDMRVTREGYVDVKRLVPRHLDYYRAHGISPVTYHGDQQAHFERRASLYRSLRLTPLAFRHSRVLEVAAGSGQNAEYLESLNPAELVLVEPNPLHPAIVGNPNLRQTTLEEFDGTGYDIVICENWLGNSEHELSLLRKLGDMVSPNGVLVLTCISRAGLQPNLLRRQIAARLVTDDMLFDRKTAILKEAFSSHLNTMQDMTRSHEDWIQDVLLNPAYDGIQLTLPKILRELGDEFTVLGTSPEFATDFRWFKSLHGDQRGFNQHVLEAHNACQTRFESYLDEDGTPGLDEALALLRRLSFTAQDVANMGPFKRLFGRETIYMSLQKC